jgi:hypothetical protein
LYEEVISLRFKTQNERNLAPAKLGGKIFRTEPDVRTMMVVVPIGDPQLPEEFRQELK